MKSLRLTGIGTTFLWALTLAVPMVSMPGEARAASVLDALAGGKAEANIRYRFETNNTSDAGNLDSASASTLRTRLGYRTGMVGEEGCNFQGFIEFENVATIDGDHYSDGVSSNGAEPYDTVLDPTGSELNQAYIDHNCKYNTLLRVGRQRVKLDNDRFIGNVGWRQNEQTYDAVALVNTYVPDLTITLAHVFAVNKILFTHLDAEAELLNVKYTGLDVGAVSVYGYFINTNALVAASSASSATQTIGLRYVGSFDVSDATRAHLTVEYASQGEYADSGVADTTYMFAEAGATNSGVTGKVGYEVLGQDGTGATLTQFETPLATAHAFNGWADKFVDTPSGGLVDLMLSVTGKVSGIKLMGVYHDFSADEGSADFGTEIDLLAVKKVAKGTKLGVKYASFSADNSGGQVDTDKLWVFAETSF
ncbi:MAG: alginate export family protein [Leptospirillia bacterium]